VGARRPPRPSERRHDEQRAIGELPAGRAGGGRKRTLNSRKGSGDPLALRARQKALHRDAEECGDASHSTTDDEHDEQTTTAAIFPAVMNHTQLPVSD
jgi:hypothetical protein